MYKWFTFEFRGCHRHVLASSEEQAWVEARYWFGMYFPGAKPKLVSIDWQ
jgi:hypothetical protein